MAEHCDIVVVGSGMIGLAAAGALDYASHGQLQIVVVDSAAALPPPPEQIEGLRVSALSPASVALLTELDVWAGVEAFAQPYRDMRVWEAASQPFANNAVHFSADMLGERQLGYLVENDRVRSALAARLAKRDIELRFGQALTDIQRRRDAAMLTFADGTLLTARLVIGADGANSVVRRSLGIAGQQKRYDQSALVLHARPEHSHDDTAWQQFNDDGPLALLPLADTRVSIVRSAPPATIAQLQGLSDTELGAALTGASNGALGTLTPASPRASFPLGAAQAETYAVDRAVLMGDAAHRVHPLAGQGANLGMADVTTLVAALAAPFARRGDPGDPRALAKYGRTRRREARRTIVALDVLQRLFDASAAPLASIRRTGMGWFNASAAVKRATARAAMGLRDAS